MEAKEKVLAFDLEIATVIGEGSNWKNVRPLGITCAAVALNDGTMKDWAASKIAGGMRMSEMLPQDAVEIVDYLLCRRAEGYSIITWNGLGFDFDVLAEEAGGRLGAVYSDLVLLAVGPYHVDIAFHMLCEKGFMVGMAAACEGMKIEGKLDGMSGAQAPEMWHKSLEDQDRVIAYCRQDATATLGLYQVMMREGKLNWISKSGRWNTWKLNGGGILPVAGAARLPLPDTGWMTAPWPRSKFYGWTGIDLQMHEADQGLDALDRIIDASVPVDQPKLKGLEQN